MFENDNRFKEAVSHFGEKASYQWLGLNGDIRSGFLEVVNLRNLPHERDLSAVNILPKKGDYYGIYNTMFYKKKHAGASGGT